MEVFSRRGTYRAAHAWGVKYSKNQEKEYVFLKLNKKKYVIRVCFYLLKIRDKGRVLPVYCQPVSLIRV